MKPTDILRTSVTGEDRHRLENALTMISLQISWLLPTEANPTASISCVNCLCPALNKSMPTIRNKVHVPGCYNGLLADMIMTYAVTTGPVRVYHAKIHTMSMAVHIQAHVRLY